MKERQRERMRNLARFDEFGFRKEIKIFVPSSSLGMVLGGTYL